VAGSYPVHIQVPSNSGRVDLFHVGRSDFTMTTTPHLGATVSFQVFGEPGRDAYLLSSPHVSAPGLTVPAWGTLHLDPAGLSIRPVGVIGPDGSATTTWTLPSDPALLGVSHYYQGLTDSAGRRLTWDWLVVTNLP
jgi:hypothetical protein